MRGIGRVRDRQVELAIGMLLRVGVIVAATVVLAGGVLYVAQQGAERATYGSFSGEPASLRDIPAIVRSAVSLDGRGLIQAGLLFLIAVPVMRVAVSIVAFLLERDWLYVVVTAIVLTVLLYSLLGGRG